MQKDTNLADERHRDENFENVFSSSNRDAESEAETIRGLLESAGIEAMLVRENVPELPTGLVEVRVLESEAAEARRVIEEARRPEG